MICLSPKIFQAFIMRIFHNSEHVIRYIGMRYDEGRIEMFLEYADGGELFDHIGKVWLLMLSGTLLQVLISFFL